MKAVVLAAGEGRRLARVSGGLPKPLVTLFEKPLLAHVLARLEEASLLEIILVTGSQTEHVENFLNAFSTPLKIQIVHNPNVQRENGYSLLCARSWIKEDRFVLAMGDHLVDPELYRVAVKARGPGLCVDRTPSLSCQTNDATRVWVEENQIKQISKELSHWNAIDTGIFSLDQRIFDALDSLREEKLTLTRAIRALIAQGHTVQALDVSGKFWSDIDTPEDLQEIEQCSQLFL
jgi:choline kinase